MLAFPVAHDHGYALPGSSQAHQFYAPLPSPGDGFRQMVRRMPAEQPLFAQGLSPEAYSFLGSLGASYSVYNAPRAVSKVRHWDQRDTGRLERFNRLPNELLEAVLVHAAEQGDGCSLMLASQRLSALAQPLLYRRLKVQNSQSLSLLLRTLRETPRLAHHVRAVDMQSRHFNWKAASELGELLQQKGRVRDLRVGFAASDLPQALPFLLCFSPKTFEWTTSPCWMMRPAHLFSQLLRAYSSTLHTLNLGGFAYDSVLAAVVSSSAPDLEELHLRGSAIVGLKPEVLLELLENKIGSVVVHGYPALRKLELLAQMYQLVNSGFSDRSTVEASDECFSPPRMRTRIEHVLRFDSL